MYNSMLDIISLSFLTHELLNMIKRQQILYASAILIKLFKIFISNYGYKNSEVQAIQC